MTPSAFRCTLGLQTQLLFCLDLEAPDSYSVICHNMPPKIRAVYSDPPWNPGNLRYWRTFNGQQVATDNYTQFLDAWVSVVVQCQVRGATDVLVEQSIIPAHSGLMLEAAVRNRSFVLPNLEHWTIQYSSPKRPNSLWHFGRSALSTDPTDMSGEKMTRRAFEGMSPALSPGDWIVDPCMGLGTTSRVSHLFKCNVFGTELNPKRLAVTVAWLEKKGYTIEPFEPI